MATIGKPTQVPIYREMEALYVWLSSVTARAPKIPAWEITCAHIHNIVLDALFHAEAGLQMEDEAMKLEHIDLLMADVNRIKTIFRLFCRMSANYAPRVVTQNQEVEFSKRMIRISNNLLNWRNAHLSQ